METQKGDQPEAQAKGKPATKAALKKQAAAAAAAAAAATAPGKKKQVVQKTNQQQTSAAAASDSGRNFLISKNGKPGKRFRELINEEDSEFKPRVSQKKLKTPSKNFEEPAKQPATKHK